MALFDNVSTPKWLAPEERNAIINQDARASMAPFQNAFSMAFNAETNRKKIEDERDFAKKENERITLKNQGVADQLKGFTTPSEALSFMSKNPQLLVDKETAPMVSDWLKVNTELAGIAYKMDNTKRAAALYETVKEHEDGYNALDAKTKAELQLRPNQSWIIDSSGQRIGLDPFAIDAVNANNKKLGLLPLGVKKNQLNPSLSPQSTIGKLQSDYENAVKNGAPQEVIDAYKKAIEKSSSTDTPGAQNVKQIELWESEAAQIDKQAEEAKRVGNQNNYSALKSKAESLRRQASTLRESMQGSTTTLGYDDQGRPIITTGGKGADSTVATQSKSQARLIHYENATQLMQWLSENLREDHVGARGTVGEFVNDRLLGQIVPDSVDKDRVESRTTLKALKEGLVREMSDDTSGRFSKEDRKAIEGALPDDGIFENLTDAKTRIARVREILADRGRVYARSIGQMPPIWAMDSSEIKKLYQDGVKSGLDPRSPEFQKKYLTKEQAVDALNRFHGYPTN